MFGTGNTIQLARVFGIRVGASPSWFVVLFVIIYLLTGRFGEDLGVSDSAAFGVAVAGAFMFAASIALHELGHAFAARRQGIGVSGVDLWLLGGVAKLDRDSRTPREEFVVAAAGPAVTLAIVLACIGVALAFNPSEEAFDAMTLAGAEVGAGMLLLGWGVTVNAVLFVFNLIPAFPLDGGRIARAAAWKLTGDRNRATRISARLGQGFAWLMGALGLALALTGDTFNGLWFIVLAWFIHGSARGAVLASEFSERMDGVTAADLMDPEPVSVPADTPLVRAQDEFFLRYRWPWFPVVDDAGRYTGVLRAERVEAADPAGAAGDLVDAAGDRDFRIALDEPLEALLASEPLRRLGALLVVDRDGLLRGVVTHSRVRRALAATVTSPRLP